MWADEYSSVAHGAAAGQLLSCRGALKYITSLLLRSTSEMNGAERWGESNHTDLTLFSNFPSLPTAVFGGGGGELIQLSNIQCARILNVWVGMCDIFHTIAEPDQELYSLCRVQTDDIKTCNPGWALSLQSNPVQTARFPCQTTRGRRGWGNTDHRPAAATTPALRRL